MGYWKNEMPAKCSFGIMVRRWGYFPVSGHLESAGTVRGTMLTRRRDTDSSKNRTLWNVGLNPAQWSLVGWTHPVGI